MGMLQYKTTLNRLVSYTYQRHAPHNHRKLVLNQKLIRDTLLSCQSYKHRLTLVTSLYFPSGAAENRFNMGMLKQQQQFSPLIF